MKSGIELIGDERLRQIAYEGCSCEHDDEHTGGELSDAAACYAMGRRLPVWPWGIDWWKPTPNDRVRELVKAGALIVAEIDRLQRLRHNTRDQRPA